MKTPTVLTLLVILFLIAACAKTEVVKLDEKPTEQPTATPEPSQPANQTSSEPTTTTTTKVATNCVDTDGNDIYSSGKVTVTYDDGSKQEFVDECPVKNEAFQTEYICVGKDAKPRTSICANGTPCVAGICLE
jgi:hypothetical protein